MVLFYLSPAFSLRVHMHLCAKVRSGCFALSALDNVIQQNLRTCTKKINHNMAMSYVYSNTNINIFKITFVHKLACTVATCIRIHTLFVGTTISAFFSIVLYGKRASMLRPWGSMVWGIGMRVFNQRPRDLQRSSALSCQYSYCPFKPYPHVVHSV